MNVLIFTPMYYLKGRKDLIHDSSAIHYLVRPWAANDNVLVVYIYFNSIKQIYRYLKKESRERGKGYFYEVDNVKVGLVEIQRFPKQKPHLLGYQAQKVADFALRFAESNDFYPDIIVSHIPFTNYNAVRRIYKNVRKIAVLHNTDRLFWDKKKKDSDLVKKAYDAYYVRSEALYRFFETKELVNLKKDIIYSGAPEIIIERHKTVKKHVDIVYAGKLIPLKNVDIVISAIQALQKEYNIRFHVIGDGELRKRLEIQAKRVLIPGTFTFYGELSRDVTLEMMAKMDIFVMVSAPETFGLVYIESMMCGCIPVGCKNEGIDGVIVDGENGFLVDARNVEALKSVFSKIIELDEKEKEILILNAIRTAKRFNEQDMAIRYRALLEDNVSAGAE